jgi:uncharacterized membrane protein YgdD (TMEM256/DUF423 family)
MDARGEHSTMQMRGWIGAAALFGLVAVALGAFAAYGLEASGDERAVALVETGARYQMWHALAMLGYAAHGRASRLPLALWALGIVLFSFSLYALAFGAPRAVAFVTPAGGTAFLAGWVALVWLAFRDRP